MNVFPFPQYWWLYLSFTGLIVGLLWIDLTLHRSDRPPTLRNASAWTAVWILLALGFCAMLYLFVSARYSAVIGRQVGMEFIAGYLMEKSLSVDNMFIFALIFRHFGLPPQHQHRVLFYGVLTAIVYQRQLLLDVLELGRAEDILGLVGEQLLNVLLRVLDSAGDVGVRAEQHGGGSRPPLLHGFNPFEEIGEGGRVVARLVDILQPQQIRLAFEAARELQKPRGTASPAPCRTA